MRFFLIDRLLTVNKGKNATAIKNVSLSEDYFEEHFPGNPLMPGVLILESIIQTGIWLLLVTYNFKSYPKVKSVYRTKFRKIVRPGSQIILDVELISNDNNFINIKGRAKIDKQLIANADLIYCLNNSCSPEVMNNLKKHYTILTDNMFQFMEDPSRISSKLLNFR